MFTGGKGTGKAEFDSPTGIAVGANGNVLVADTNNDRIEKFSPSGTFLSTIGTKGRGRGQLAGPNGIAVATRAGFLLSPVVENRQSFSALASTNWQHELANLRVVSASITTEESPGVTICYQSPVRLRFYRLSLQRQDLSQRP